MKKKLFLALAILFFMVSALPAHAESRGIVFQRFMNNVNWVLMSDLDGKNEVKLFNGCDQDVSPDGSKIAFTYTPPEKGKSASAEFKRYIAIYDVNTKKTSVIKKIPSTNSYAPRWSPDGKRLLFNIFLDVNGTKHWRFGVYNVEGDKVDIIVKDATSPSKKVFDAGLYSPFWVDNGAAVCCNDFNYFYKFSAETGRQIEAIPSGTVMPKNTALDSAVEFSALKNGHWIFCAELSDERCKQCEPTEMKGALLEYLPDSKKIVRISPSDYCVQSAAYTNDGRVVFAAHKIGSKPSSIDNPNDIYIMDTADKKPRLLIKKAWDARVF